MRPIWILLIILLLLLVFGCGSYYCYERFINSKVTNHVTEKFEKLGNPDIKLYQLESTEIIGDPYSKYEPKTKMKVNRPEHPKWYQDATEEDPEVQNLYKQAEKLRRDTKKYTKFGFEKRKAPKEVFDYLKEIAHNTDRIKEDSRNIFKRTSSGPPPYIIPFPEEKKKWIAEKIRPILEEWSGVPLKYTCLYGARDYPRDSALRMHCDRDSHIISAIFHIEREGCQSSVDNEVSNWALEVLGHDGIKRDIYMEPGEMILYESHSLPHAREKPNPCDSFVNAFLHFSLAN